MGAAGTRRCLLAMLLGKDRSRHDIGDGGLEFVLPSAHHIAFPVHHGLEAGPGHIGGIVLLALSNRGVEHVGAGEELGLGGTRHETGDRHAGVFQLGPQRKREGIQERLAGVVDGLIGAGDEPRLPTTYYVS